MDPVKTEYGYVSGIAAAVPETDVQIYRGIPYAAPPLGERRWKPPEPPVSWSGVLECIDFSKSSPQPPRPNPDYNIPRDEDCLYLNIITPVKTGEEKLPVMVWFHGGGYVYGTGNNQLSNSPRLPQTGIVLVTVNMRLDTTGLLAHPLLSEESANGISGNYMFLDMLAALKWVNGNIAAFNGNPDNITIFGQSGGGAKVATLMCSPFAKGLFHRAICESGTSTGDFSPGMPLKDLEVMGERLFAKLGVNKEKDPLASARAIHWTKVQECTQSLMEELSLAFSPGGLWDAAIDGYFLNESPLNIFRSCRQNPVPLITCANLGEIMIPTDQYSLSFLIPAYIEMLSSQEKAGVKSYACIFDQVPKQWREDGVPSTHSLELCYVFGDWDNSTDAWSSLRHNSCFVKSKYEDPGLTEIDRNISEEMMRRWVQFAKTGNPNIDDSIKWPHYESSTDQYLYISDPIEARSGFSLIGQ